MSVSKPSDRKGLGASPLRDDRATDAPHEAPAGLRPDGSVSTGAWKRGTFVLKMNMGFGTIEEWTVAGLIKGEFGLDCRRSSGGFVGWMISHIPTGYGIFAVHAAKREAQRIADEIAALGDWGFTDPQRAKPFTKAIEEIEGREPRASRSLGSLPLAQAIEARRAATAKTGAVEDESAVPKGCAQ